jgi:uncharacterized protein YndB with AHSA1/START domain
MIAGDTVTVTVTVDVPPPRAFAVFTEEIDLWWRRGPAYRVAGRPALRADHPVRHGQPVPEFIRTIGMWWGQLLSSLRDHAEP